MYCSKCGKKITDDMLFCPFCGAPVVIPEQQEEETAAPGLRDVEPEPVAQDEPGIWSAEEGSIVEDVPEQEDVRLFEPLDFDDTLRRIPLVHESTSASREAARTEAAEQASGTSSGRKAAQTPSASEPPRTVGLSGHAPEIGSGRRRDNTYTPRRQFDPDNIFMESDLSEDYGDDEDDGLYYEEEERGKGSFVSRHLRGIIAFSMLLALIAFMGIWALSPSGQRFLASADLAWDAKPYADLAHEAYDAQSYAQAAIYYEKAFKRDSTDAGYAVNAAICCIWAQDTAGAERLARQAIQADPLQAEAYKVLLRVYPDAATRPADVINLIRDGYACTHDEELNI